MKAYVLECVGKLEYREIDVPQIRRGEVLVEVKAAGICGSDIPRIFETGTYSFPLIPGHEFAGIVVKVGEGVEKSWLNKKVGIFPLIPCMECPSCREEAYEMCYHYNYLGSRCNGGFAEYAAVPAWNLLELPKEFDMRQAAMLEPAAVALHAARKLCLKKENSIALFGLGTIGVILTQWLALYGVEKVIATGHREEFGSVMQKTANQKYVYGDAHEMGNREWVKKYTHELGADIVIDCIGNSESLSDCLESVKPGGQILMVGNPTGDMCLTQKVYWKLLRKQVKLLGTWNSSFTHRKEDDWHTVVQACVEGKLDLLSLISHELPFEGLKEGLDIMREKREYRNKIMIVS